MKEIDRESPLPIYYQIAVDMRKRIQLQEWQIGQQLPTEPDLADLYHVSRVTLRQAISELVKDGYLRQQRGSGTFVTEKPKPIIYTLGLPVSFSQRIIEMGYTPGAQILETNVFSNPYPEILKHLRLQPDEPIAYIKRLLTVDKLPVAIDRSWFSERLCPGISQNPLIQNSISKTLSSRYHLTTVRSETTFETISASVRDADILESYPEAPLILLTTDSYFENDVPVEHSTTSWLGERVRFHFNMTPH